MLDGNFRFLEPYPDPTTQIPDARHIGVKGEGAVDQACAFRQLAERREGLASPAERESVVPSKPRRLMRQSCCLPAFFSS